MGVTDHEACSRVVVACGLFGTKAAKQRVVS